MALVSLIITVAGLIAAIYCMGKIATWANREKLKQKYMDNAIRYKAKYDAEHNTIMNGQEAWDYMVENDLDDMRL